MRLIKWITDFINRNRIQPTPSPLLSTEAHTESPVVPFNLQDSDSIYSNSEEISTNGDEFKSSQNILKIPNRAVTHIGFNHVTLEADAPHLPSNIQWECISLDGDADSPLIL